MGGRYNKNDIERACFRWRRPRHANTFRPYSGYEEDCAMLPCQDSCPDYQMGCHKQCQRWREYQQRQQIPQPEIPV